MFFGKAAGVSWHDRGEILCPDYELGDLTEDDAFHDLDLSGIVGAAVRLVLLRVRIAGAADHNRVIFKRKGATENPNISFVYVFPTVHNFDTSIWAYTDAAGKIEYKFSNVVWTYIELSVRGWFY